MSFKHCLCIFILVFLTNCSKDSKELPPLTTEAKESIENYAKALVNSINQGDHKLIRDSFKYDAFPALVTNLSRSEQMVFDYIFDKDIRDDIKYHNVDLINQLHAGGGKVHLGQVSHGSGSSEIQLIVQWEGNFDFLKYRVAMIKEKPYLVDFGYLKQESWYSEQVKNMVLLNSKYTSLSEKRREAVIALKASNQALYEQDTVSAFEYLALIPKEFWVGHGLSIRKINYAAALGDSIYRATLEQEAQNSQSLFIQYQWAMVKEDTSSYLQQLDRMMTEVGNDELINTLIEQGLIWF